MKKTVSRDEKERIYDITYAAIRSGIANGDYQDIDVKIKAIMRQHLDPEQYDTQIYMLRDFIGYMRKRVVAPGGRLGMVALIALARSRGVPKFLTDCGTAIWGTFFSNKANSAKLRELFLT